MAMSKGGRDPYKEELKAAGLFVWYFNIKRWLIEFQGEDTKAARERAYRIVQGEEEAPAEMPDLSRDRMNGNPTGNAPAHGLKAPGPKKARAAYTENTARRISERISSKASLPKRPPEAEEGGAGAEDEEVLDLPDDVEDRDAALNENGTFRDDCLFAYRYYDYPVKEVPVIGVRRSAQGLLERAKQDPKVYQIVIEEVKKDDAEKRQKSALADDGRVIEALERFSSVRLMALAEERAKLEHLLKENLKESANAQSA